MRRVSILNQCQNCGQSELFTETPAMRSSMAKSFSPKSCDVWQGRFWSIAAGLCAVHVLGSSSSSSGAAHAAGLRIVPEGA